MTDRPSDRHPTAFTRPRLALRRQSHFAIADILENTDALRLLPTPRQRVPVTSWRRVIRFLYYSQRDEMAKANARRTPAPLNMIVSAQMQRMPRSSTSPEMLIRRELHRRGLRFRVNHPRLPGRPDVAFTAARIAVFVDGCFWHSCPDHGLLPKNNRAWWQEKLERNVQRDREKDALLEKMGWTVLHVWEHERPLEAADAIDQLWSSVRGTAARRAGEGARTRDM